MKALTYNEVIDNILKILEMVQSGEEIVIKNVKTQENVAVIVPRRKHKDPFDRLIIWQAINRKITLI